MLSRGGWSEKKSLWRAWRCGSNGRASSTARYRDLAPSRGVHQVAPSCAAPQISVPRVPGITVCPPASFGPALGRRHPLGAAGLPRSPRGMSTPTPESIASSSARRCGPMGWMRPCWQRMPSRRGRPSPSPEGEVSRVGREPTLRVRTAPRAREGVVPLPGRRQWPRPRHACRLSKSVSRSDDNRRRTPMSRFACPECAEARTPARGGFEPSEKNCRRF